MTKKQRDVKNMSPNVKTAAEKRKPLSKKIDSKVEKCRFKGKEKVLSNFPGGSKSTEGTDSKRNDSMTVQERQRNMKKAITVKKRELPVKKDEDKKQQTAVDESVRPAAQKKKKRHKKNLQDGMSNWMQLCLSTNSDALKRKKDAVKRSGEALTDGIKSEPAPKKAKQDIWFDNVDKFLIETPSETQETNGAQSLVKPDSYTGITKCVAMDCEMVGVGATGEESILARVSLVNQHGVCLYDKYVLPRESVTDYRTYVSGVTKEKLETGEEFTKVQKEVSDLLKGRILVGHALHNDMKVLYLSHPRKDIRDTSRYKPFRALFSGRLPSLKKLTHKVLGVSVQEGEHSSVQDAQAAMKLYSMNRQRWEAELRLKRKPKITKKKKKKEEADKKS